MQPLREGNSNGEEDSHHLIAGEGLYERLGVSTG
jgi:hypothetical protein